MWMIICFKVVVVCLFISTEVSNQRFGCLYSVDEPVFTGPTHHRRIKPFIGTTTGNISGMWDEIPGEPQCQDTQKYEKYRDAIKKVHFRRTAQRAQRLWIQCNMQNVHPVLSHAKRLFPRTMFWITLKHWFGCKYSTSFVSKVNSTRVNN